MKSFKGKYIWIIGASSGIGYALAEKLSREGACLALSARSEDELKALQVKLPKPQPPRHEESSPASTDHIVCPIDVSDHKALARTASEISARFPRIDSIIHLAAIYKPTSFAEMQLEDAHKLIDININGTLNLIKAVLPILNSQGSGQLALTGSVAGYCGLPNGQPYSATKAAIINMTESLRAEQPKLDIKLICPGFVKTPMTDENPFPMPFIIEPEQAASEIADGLLSSRFEIHFPKRLTILMKLLKRAPSPLYFFITRRMVKDAE